MFIIPYTIHNPLHTPYLTLYTAKVHTPLINSVFYIQYKTHC